MKSWASSLTGAGRRESLVRAALAVVLVGALVWLLPLRRPGEEGGHHAEPPAPALDAFEKAGVTEFKGGQRGPPFTLTTLDGGRASLADDHDKLVVLNFWATWCQPVTMAMPTFDSLWRGY
ncbi:MAG: TlpA family protein disulfide reductase [Candidatus Rokuibacteriota bacterium]